MSKHGKRAVLAVTVVLGTLGIVWMAARFTEHATIPYSEAPITLESAAGDAAETPDAGVAGAERRESIGAGAVASGQGDGTSVASQSDRTEPDEGAMVLGRVTDQLTRGAMGLEELAEVALELLRWVDTSTARPQGNLLRYDLRDPRTGAEMGTLLVSSGDPPLYTMTVPEAPASPLLLGLDPECTARLQLAFRRGETGLAECKALVQHMPDYSDEVFRQLRGIGPLTVGGYFEATAQGTFWRPVEMDAALDPAGQPEWRTDVGQDVPLGPAAFTCPQGQHLALALGAL